MQRLALNVYVGAAFLLDLPQDIVSGCAIDDELFVSPAVAAIDGKAPSDAGNHELQKICQRDIRKLPVVERLAEQEQIILALERYGAIIRADALHPALELPHHANLSIAQIYRYAVASMYLLLDIERDIVFRAREGDNGAVGQLLDGAGYIHPLQHSQLIIADLYVELHRKHGA